MSQLYDEVLSAFLERLNDDEHVSDAVASSLRVALEHTKPPSATELTEIFQHAAGDTIG